MNIYAAASLFAILILLYWIISEVFTVLFRLIGLPEEKARFQVVSMLTGAGFTTHESEMILSTRSRRRLGRVTMLFGFVFNVTIVSAFVNFFVSMKVTAVGNTVLSMLIPVAALTAILLLTKHHRVQGWLDRHIEKAADRYGNTQGVNSVTVIDQIGIRTIARAGTAFMKALTRRSSWATTSSVSRSQVSITGKHTMSSAASSSQTTAPGKSGICFITT